MLSKIAIELGTELISENINPLWLPLTELCTLEDNAELLTLARSACCNVIYVPEINNTYITSQYLNSPLHEAVEMVVNGSRHEMPGHNDDTDDITQWLHEGNDIRLLIVQICHYNEVMEASTTYPSLLLFTYNQNNNSTTIKFVGVNQKMTWTDTMHKNKSHLVSEMGLGV